MNVEGGGCFLENFWVLVLLAVGGCSQFFFLRCPLVVVLVVVAVKSFGQHEIYIIDLLTN